MQNHSGSLIGYGKLQAPARHSQRGWSRGPLPCHCKAPLSISHNSSHGSSIGSFAIASKARACNGWTSARENAQAVKIQSIDRSKLEVQDAHVPYDCAAAVGALHATNLMHLMLPLCAALFLVVLLPVALQVASMSGNGIAHVLVTSAYCALPVGLAALILHPVVAWLIERHCRRTPFSKLLDDYRWRIQCDPHPGPDAVHPSNQGFWAQSGGKLDPQTVVRA